jgi:hypothetical protein
MNFYNTPGGAGIMKVLESSKKVLEAILIPLQNKGYHLGDSHKSNTVPCSTAQSHIFNWMI